MVNAVLCYADNFLRPLLLPPPLRKPNARTSFFCWLMTSAMATSRCYGQKQIATPNLDQLAAGGLRFTQAYSGSTVCAPSRCCLFTGKHTGHALIRGNGATELALAKSDTIIPEVLKRAGYRTAIFGKWALGGSGDERLSA